LKCTKCGELLDASPGKNVNFCPNCGSKVTAKPAASVTDSAEAALHHIAETFGADVLLGSKVATYFADVTHNQLRDEKDLIKILQEKGALDCLKEAMQKPVSEQKTAIKRAMSKLPKFLQGSEDAEAMLRGFAAALGWQLPKPQPAPPPKQLIPAQTPQHTVILPKQATANKPLSVTPAIGSIHKFANIDWRVLDVDKQNNKALLISEEILEKCPYNDKPLSITWENCTLCKYLNGEFLDKLGAANSAIAETRNNNPNNQWFGAPGGNATNDKVFLLSLDEVCRYFGDSTVNLRRKSGLFISDENNPKRVANYGSKAALWWWLRSPGITSTSAAGVIYDGRVFVCGSNVDIDSGGVRPALWLNL
jgi:DNA-directed RNA polymerase subunit RPC12/RpoP